MNSNFLLMNSPLPTARRINSLSWCCGTRIYSLFLPTSLLTSSGSSAEVLPHPKGYGCPTAALQGQARGSPPSLATVIVPRMDMSLIMVHLWGLMYYACSSF